MTTTLHVPRVDRPLTLADRRWADLPAHTMTFSKDKPADPQPREPGCFRVAHDTNAVFLKLELTDRDVVTRADADGQKLWLLGDLAEWFIGYARPDGTHVPYYELHITPNGVRSAYLQHRPALLNPVDPPHRAEVAVDGALNDLTQDDRGWSVQFTLDHAHLDAIKPGPDARLTMLVARYNYGRHLPPDPDTGSAGPELTMWPAQPKSRYHLRPFHAPVVFE